MIKCNSRRHYKHLFTRRYRNAVQLCNYIVRIYPLSLSISQFCCGISFAGETGDTALITTHRGEPRIFPGSDTDGINPNGIMFRSVTWPNCLQMDRLLFIYDKYISSFRENQFNNINLIYCTFRNGINCF